MFVDDGINSSQIHSISSFCYTYIKRIIRLCSKKHTAHRASRPIKLVLSVFDRVQIWNFLLALTIVVYVPVSYVWSTRISSCPVKIVNQTYDLYEPIGFDRQN